jgi:hypothetical protein
MIAKESVYPSLKKKQLWNIRLFCLLLTGLLGVAIWAHMPYLIVEHRRIESWKFVGLLSGDLIAVAWFFRFVCDHAIFAQPFSALPVRDGRRHFRVAAIGGIAAIIIDLAFAFHLMAIERRGYERARVIEAQVLTIQTHNRSAATWYEVECSFLDEAGQQHKVHLRMQADRHVLPPELSAQTVLALTTPSQAGGLISIRYDRNHPPRAWIDGSGWEDHNGFYWFSILTLFFQTLVTGLFLMLLIPYARGNVLPWWWDGYKVFPLKVQAFWMLTLGLIDRFLD